MEIAQYDIVLVNLDKAVGAKIQKTRPCAVISPDEMNRYLQTIVVAPITTRSRVYPTRLRVRYNKKTGWIAVDQLRTIARKRIIRILGTLSGSEIRKLKDVIRETFVD